MTRAVGFDNEKYLDDQSRSILERIGRIGGKLYLEFGGKIAFDYHAARVLPGYDPNAKIRLLQKLRDRAAGYAKFETFPIWNLPLRHPVNVAYEAATVELNDVNLIDPFHLAAYGEQAVNYNRDVDAFPLLAPILQRITDGSSYRSPTDMGVNRAGFAIVDDARVRAAAEQEVIRRHFRYACEYAVGLVEREDADRAKLIMSDLGLDEGGRAVVGAARLAAAEAEACGKGNDGVYCGAWA